MDSKPIENILENALTTAHTLKHEYLTVDHIAVPLLGDPTIAEICTNLNIEVDVIINDILKYLSDAEYNGLVCTNGSKGSPKKTEAVERVVQRALAQVIFQGGTTVQPVDMLISILAEDDCYARYYCELNGLSKDAIIQYAENDIASAKDSEFIDEFTTNLNELAKKNEIDPLIGRETEVDDLVHILARRKKNNCVLVGEPGVGKTAIAEGLAKRIVDQEVPEILQNKVVYSLNVGDLLAGTRYRGDFEERIKQVLEILADNPDSVLFIDEIHMIMGAGSSGNNNVDIANLIKPILGKGKLLTVGATTPDEFASTFEKDRALMRRFARVDIEETNVEDTKKIIRGLKGHYEKFHNVSYTDDLLDKVVDLADRYIKNKHFPDKAFDIVDAVGALVKLDNRDTVTSDDVVKVVSKISKVNTDMVDVDKRDGYHTLDTKIKSTVYGQDRAVDTLVEAILVAKAGLREKNKPVGSFLFVGPTGTGKTETARALANSMESKLIKFDMSEYMEKHSVSKLIGAPPGYVGHAEGKMGQGKLLAEVEAHPNCVLLLDEVEKAAPEVLQVLLQVMDDGKLTGGTGKMVDFSNVVLLMTSNLGAADAETLRIGFGDQTRQNATNKAIEKFFTPEFRNRLDAIVEFDKLAPELMEKIVSRLINETNALLADNDSNNVIKVTDTALSQLASDGYQPSMGARPLKRVFENEIKKPLSRKILFDNLNNATITVDYDDDQYIITSE